MCARELGHIFDAVDDEKHPAIRIEYRRIHGRPVPFLVTTAFAGRLANIEFLHRHGVRSTLSKNPLKGCTEIGGPGSLLILRATRKDLKKRSPYDFVAFRVGRAKISVTRIQNGETLIRPEEEEESRSAYKDFW
jgi:hypothetical protein